MRCSCYIFLLSTIIIFPQTQVSELSDKRVVGKVENLPIINEPKIKFEVQSDNVRVKADIIEMIFVEGGMFKMGSNNGRDDEKPKHNVTLSSFYIGKYEVTQKEWEDVMGNNPSNFKGADRPVENVSWRDIQIFIETLNKKTKNKYRLPTEAEWEYAAKGGSRSKGYKYCGSNDINSVAWYGGFYNNSNAEETHPVGQKKANELGIYDMSGNVWEWCSDWYDKNYYEKSPSKNPQGAASGTYRVARGGAWIFKDGYCRSSCRYWNNPDSRLYYNGFRLVQE